ncbi:hypothetical protein F5Y07DRAFT_382937 [Xylaria sp. FL0933]|nr:hypothetical protein F5Y07DRAFT_382937 [Xylaria sp. FL0933]
MSREFIHEWFRYVDAANVDYNNLVAAKIYRKHGLTFPPISLSQTKKRRQQDNQALLFISGDRSPETPRTVKRRDINSDTRFMSQALSLLSDHTGQTSNSGRGSPTKMLAKLEIREMRQRAMNNTESGDYPKPLEKLIEDIEKAITLHNGLFYKEQREQISKYVEANPTRRQDFKICYERDELYTNSRDKQLDSIGLCEYERRLNPEFVRFILDEARDCDERSYDEASWNMRVHYPLMRRVITGASEICDSCGDTTVTVVPCTTARLIGEFKVPSSKAHKVDFALALKPAQRVADALELQRIFMPERSLNHTDYKPLLDQPIAVSVETDNDFENAKVQLMVWLAAQWRKLESMAVSPPELLPAIIIQGHDWFLVASTRANNGTKTFWYKTPIGSTSKPLGIFKIAWTLQYLSRWAVSTHWSWFKTTCLGFDMDSEEQDLCQEQATE